MPDVPGCLGCCDALGYARQALGTVLLIMTVSYVIKVLLATTPRDSLETYAIDDDYWYILWMVTGACFLLWLIYIVCFVWCKWRGNREGYTHPPTV